MDTALLDSVTIDVPAALPMRVTKAKRKPLTLENCGDNGDAGDTACSGASSVPNGLGTTGDTGDIPANSSSAPQNVAREWLPDSAFEERDPTIDEAPRYLNRLVGNAEFKRGLFYFGVKPGRGDNASTLTTTRIGEPLIVASGCASTAGFNSGRVLRYTDGRGRDRTYSLAMRKLAGDGVEYRAELLDAGYRFDTEQGRMLTRYINLRPVDLLPHLHSVDRTGWHGAGESLAYVLPDTVIGAPDFVLQSDDAGSASPYTVAGMLDGWRDRVAVAGGDRNPLVTLAISTAFAGALLHRVGRLESIALHLYGASSRGKTTALLAACSVWGGTDILRKWRATANGVESAAALSNDALLALDEIGQCDPRDIGRIVYAVTDGTGKARSTKSGGARAIAHWRTAILSSGEHSISQAIEEGGKRAAAGQTVRLLDVPIGEAVIVHQCGFDSPGALAESMREACVNHHGTPAREFVNRLITDSRSFSEEFAAYCESEAFARGEGQERRAGQAFALIAMAGELATEYGLTGWQAGDAIGAASQSFARWLADRGNTGKGLEAIEAVNHVRDFIVKFGGARFESFTASEGTPRIPNRAGWVQQDGERRTFYVTTGAMREAIGSLDLKTAAKALNDAGMIAKADNDRSHPFTCKPRIPSLSSSQRVYAIVLPDEPGVRVDGDSLEAGF